MKKKMSEEKSNKLFSSSRDSKQLIMSLLGDSRELKSKKILKQVACDPKKEKVIEVDVNSFSSGESSNDDQLNIILPKSDQKNSMFSIV